jgi:AraC-like DNA-binding protein
LKAIPVILLTTEEAVIHGLHGLECGADDYLFKPFTQGEAQIRITNLLLSHEHHARHAITREIETTREISTEEDHELLDRTLRILGSHLRDDDYSVDQLAAELGLSRRRLAKRLKGITGAGPLELLNRMRIHRAKELLETHPGTGVEVALELGFGSATRFSRAFKKVSGLRPSECGLTV